MAYRSIQHTTKKNLSVDPKPKIRKGTVLSATTPALAPFFAKQKLNLNACEFHLKNDCCYRTENKLKHPNNTRKEVFSSIIVLSDFDVFHTNVPLTYLLHFHFFQKSLFKLRFDLSWK